MKKVLNITVSFFLTSIFLISSLGYGVYKHVCIECNDFETTLSHHNHQHNKCLSFSCLAHIDFHKKHKTHKQDCKGSFYKIKSFFLDSKTNSIKTFHVKPILGEKHVSSFHSLISKNKGFIEIVSAYFPSTIRYLAEIKVFLL